MLDDKIRDIHGTGQSRSMTPIICVANLSKTYASGFQALKGINLDIRSGETHSEIVDLQGAKKHK